MPKMPSEQTDRFPDCWLAVVEMFEARVVAQERQGHADPELARDLPPFVAGLQQLERRRLQAVKRERQRLQLDAMLPVLIGIYGKDYFSIAELRHSNHAALRPVLQGLSGAALGRLFRGWIGQPIDGLLLERIDVKAGRPMLWRVLQVL
jgi:hypothetical protein